jgi:hypothetical protein
MNSPQILNRPLQRVWLDAALRAARSSASIATRRWQLSDVLDESELGFVAKRKTARVLDHIWIDPPARAIAAIEWAVGLAEPVDSRVLHIGAMLAVYPFIGDVYSAIGTRLRRSTELDNKSIRSRVVSKWGDREAVHKAVVMALNTLSSLGILCGEPRSGVWRKAEQLEVPPALAPWLAHVVLLSRKTHSIDVPSVSTAPELFAFSLDSIPSPERYPCLEVHTEGGDRTVLVERRLYEGVASLRH